MQDIDDLVKEMTLEEKAALCSGLDNWHTKPVGRLAIPSVMMADGPHGLRKELDSDGQGLLKESYPATCFPTASALASTWNTDLLYQVGAAMGAECQAADVQTILGPGVNIKRSPLCGRNFEYFSEDPYLSGQLAVAVINGVQSMGVGTSLKHFAANNQEHRRMLIDAVVDERALREVYLPAFEQAVKEAQPWTVMAAYNRLNGKYCTQNARLLTDLLREEWGFEGVVVSDWGAVDDRVEGIAAGMDLEMPGVPNGNEARIIKAVRAGRLPESALDDSVRRLLSFIRKADASRKVNYICDLEANHSLARKAAAEGVVLLKNAGNVLPLAKAQKIALIGAFAEKPRYQGSGSSLIHPYRMDTLLEEINSRCKPGDVTYAPGYSLEENETDVQLLNEAVQIAKEADAAIVCVGLTDMDEIEAFDRQHMSLPESHNRLVEAVAAANPRTVVLLSNGSPVEMPWIGQVPAVLEGYLAGQAGASAHAALIFGEVNPSGKLAESFPLTLEDNPSYPYFPSGPKTVEYRESIFVGYRCYDKAEKEVLFPFGHGLSYTEFEYRDLQIKKGSDIDTHLTVRFTIKNSGKTAGKETAQVYVRDLESAIVRPDKELKGFAKVTLSPGETREISIPLDDRAFAFYDVSSQAWVIEPGQFEILVGASSRDIRLKETVEIRGEQPTISLRGNKAWEEFLRTGAVSNAAYEQLTGRTLPENTPVKRPFTLETPIADMRGTLAGAIIHRMVKVQIANMVDEDIHAPTRLMIEKMALESPLRLLIMFSGGVLETNFLQALLDVANGRMIKGLRGLLKVKKQV